MHNWINKNIIKGNDLYQAENSDKRSALIKGRPIRAKLARDNKKYQRQKLQGLWQETKLLCSRR